MQEFGLNGSTLVALGRTVALLRETLTLDNCVRALETVAGQLRNLTVLMPHGGLGELILDGFVCSPLWCAPAALCTAHLLTLVSGCAVSLAVSAA